MDLYEAQISNPELFHQFSLKDDYLRSIFEEFGPYLTLKELPEPNKIMIESFAIDEHIRNSYQSFIPYIVDNKTLPNSVLENKFKELLFNIFSHPENKHILAYILRIVERYQTPIWEVMELNYRYDLKIQDFANIANRSLSTFKREFKKYYKTSLGKWNTNRRLKRVKVILQGSNKTTSQIAFDCGFNNSSHFSRLLRKNLMSRLLITRKAGPKSKDSELLRKALNSGIHYAKVSSPNK